MLSKKLFAFLLIPIAFSISILNVHADSDTNRWTGDMNVVFGAKRFSDSPWKPIDNQPTFGLMLDARQRDWPLNIALDVYYSGDQGSADGLTREGSTTENDFGIRRIWRTSQSLRPYLGLGSALIQARLKDSSPGRPSQSDSDIGAGVWIGGGLYWTLADYFNIGFNYKYSTGKVSLLDQRLDAGGRFFGTVIGLTW